MKRRCIESCPVCGGTTFTSANVLWPDLIREWNLSSSEVQYINRQQGLACTGCGNNLRSMALAAAMLRCCSFVGTLQDAMDEPRIARLHVLELNYAGGLTSILKKGLNHRCLSYPRIDLEALDLPSDTYDLVLHSDTLEHVPNPEIALAECRRVLKADGFCVFTVPVVVGRLSRSRLDCAPSYHGDPDDPRPDLLVHTEFGADVWTHVLKAGFGSCTIDCTEFPAGLALVARP